MPSCFGIRCAARRMGMAAFALVVVGGWCTALNAQFYTNQRSVGGISVDTDGILGNASVDMTGQLAQFRTKSAQQIPADLGTMTPQRKVSLRGIEVAIAEAANAGKPLPDEVKYLAGLQKIEYIFVYPDRNDIVLVGPAEGWKIDKRGNVVGATTGRPVMLLDDLLTALRTARRAAQGGISCSIDPTQEGLTRLQAHARKLRTIGNPQQTVAGIENVLGMQDISFTGVEPTSHFARVLVAADYRMKRIAMGFEPAPIQGLPSFLTMIPARSRGLGNMLPRWWLEPNYEPILHDADGLAFELRDAGVKTMTEEDFLTANGNREHTGQANPVAQRWSEMMTEKYDELAVADPIFGQLRNCMELAVVGALFVKERLPEKAQYSMPILMDAEVAKTEAFPAPKQVPSKASVLRRGRNWIISASGGVLVNSWAVADKTQQSDAPAAVRAEAVPSEKSSWRWN